MRETKKKITELLRTNGGMTAAELGDLLGISTTAVRRHLDALETRKLIHHRSEQRGMGRPSHIYELTDSVKSVFEQSFHAFADEIIQKIRQLDHRQSPENLFQRQHTKRRQQYLKLTQGETLPDRIAAIARLMEDEGRMTTWQQLGQDHFVLREHNCPFLNMDAEFDYPCRCEASLLRDSLQAQVQRVSHIRTGDIACVYEIIGVEEAHSAPVPESQPISFAHAHPAAQ
jgi:predicted ArsR family transcriptional regulator